MKTKRIFSGVIAGLIVGLSVQHFGAPDYVVGISFWFAAELGYLIKLLEQKLEVI
jgi:hypothetical protein